MLELLLIVLALLQILDIYTTYNILKLGGRELNPMLNKLFEKVGVVPGLIVPKSIYIAVLTYYYLFNSTSMQSFEWLVSLTVIVLIYVGVVFNNFKVLKAMKNSSN
jgi:hypothetical protein